jgi:hypothetical protein
MFRQNNNNLQKVKRKDPLFPRHIMEENCKLNPQCTMKIIDPIPSRKISVKIRLKHLEGKFPKRISISGFSALCLWAGEVLPNTRHFYVGIGIIMCYVRDGSLRSCMYVYSYSDSEYEYQG